LGKLVPVPEYKPRIGNQQIEKMTAKPTIKKEHFESSFKNKQEYMYLVFLCEKLEKKKE
jgi:hypothetical protein